MSFEKNQVVTFHYSVTNENKEVVDSSFSAEPLAFLAGQNQVLPKVEETLNGMLLNTKKTVTLSPQEAYGEYNEEHIQQASRGNFPADTKLEIGMQFMADMEDGGHMPFIIKAIEGDQVTIDFNHPLAGQTLTFDLELIEVRDATEEELSHGHVHGPGGHHH